MRMYPGLDNWTERALVLTIFDITRSLYSVQRTQMYLILTLYNEPQYVLIACRTLTSDNVASDESVMVTFSGSRLERDRESAESCVPTFPSTTAHGMNQ